MERVGQRRGLKGRSAFGTMATLRFAPSHRPAPLTRRREEKQKEERHRAVSCEWQKVCVRGTPEGGFWALWESVGCGVSEVLLYQGVGLWVSRGNL